MPYQWLIFDADNTLFDYDQAEKEALYQTFNQHGIQLTEEIRQLFSKINGDIWKRFENGEISSQRLRVQRFEELFKKLDFPIIAQQFSKDYLFHLGGQSGLMPGARDLVERLSNQYQLALATNGIADVQQRRLAGSELEKYFQVVVISDVIGVSKPSSAFFDVVFHRMGNPQKNQVLIVGDSLTSDIAGGKGFGIDTCWISTDKVSVPSLYKPTYQIADLQELFIILK